ncbi:MAG: phosphatase PAP2 family protein [Bdellovibrionales bacterium]|nr:phosphatase PAP2 family protein [Bdellovibrionales bacterium]
MGRIFLAFLLGAQIFVCRPTFAYSPTKHFFTGSADAFKGSNKWVWLGGLTLTSVAFIYDHDIYNYYGGKEKEEFPDAVGDSMGTGIPGASLAVLTMGVGWLFDSKKVLGAGQAHAEALVATFTYTSILKLMIERDRPQEFAPNETAENQFNASFPSGHTSTAFATAGSMMASGGPWVGIPFLALAGLTGYSRVQQRAHYAGDVIFGATLGYTMGYGFYQHHKGGKTLGWNIWPYFENRESFGVAFYNTF